jgi:hypothetical protein
VIRPFKLAIEIDESFTGHGAIFASLTQHQLRETQQFLSPASPRPISSSKTQ